ncbi:trans-aconitate 2-methyltransferase [Actinoplanes sp. TFC3]|uniref:class I SAM-dependent methyltransferase n=1 Tax=Actinoplanes sp. TFC3 TaxID=1710355 RepID=UPI001F299413|nr:class I SAM-dependent methyltransferase [Actinoplanes sp. TFC3]
MSGAPGAVLDPAHAGRWRATWAQVMAGFVPGLSTLEETMCRAAEAAGSPPGKVLDLGGGPGVLAERMARRWPAAEVSVMDIDPVLLALARSAPSDAAVRTIEADLSSSAWVGRAGADFDVIVTVMTLHYLHAAQVQALYADIRRALTPGGLLIVADLMPDDGIASLMAALDPAEGAAAADLAWAQWWSDVADIAEIAPLVAERAAVFGQRPPAEFTAPVSWHAAALGAAGFERVGLVWRCGRHAALAALV